MTAIKSERLPTDRDLGDARVPERLGDIGPAAAQAVEGEIREFVRRDVAFLRRQRAEPDAGGDAQSDNLGSLIRRVSAASGEEIDRVILDLQRVRDMLRSEGDRVGREIAGYASLSHAAMTAMKVIGESLKQWKEAPHAAAETGRRPGN